MTNVLFVGILLLVGTSLAEFAFKLCAYTRWVRRAQRLVADLTRMRTDWRAGGITRDEALHSVMNRIGEEEDKL